MDEKNQHQKREVFSTDTAGIGSGPPPGEGGQGTRSHTNQTSTRKATGPRTAKGKLRSKLNALKHGLYSQLVLLEGEPADEYISLLIELQEDRQPQGKLETVLVENLAVFRTDIRERGAIRT
jgi:hypothetical protein